MTNLIGLKLDKYEIVGLIGEGGMAAVYRARQLNVRREVAIKIIKPVHLEKLRHDEFVRRFSREAETIAALDHPHILKLFDYGQEGDLLYLVTPLLTGGNLSSHIFEKPLDLQETSRLLDQIADALDYAHSKGIVHRDMKPQNVLLDERGNAILTDFGIAKLVTETTALTQSGMTMGTPSYMAPEQWQSQALDGRADVYALGMMAFEMLTGKLPFYAETPLQLMYAHINERPRPVRALRGDLPEGVEKVLGKAMAKDVGRRFQTAGALASAFRKAVTTGSVPPEAADFDIEQEGTASVARALPVAAMPREETLPPRSGGRGVIGLAALALVALFALGGVILGGGNGAAATVTPGHTAEVVAANPTATETSIPPSATPTMTETPLPIATFTAAASATATASATFSETPIPTSTATETPSQTPIPPTITATPNLETLIAGVAATDAQATAFVIASYTATSTPDMPGTARAAFRSTQTATAQILMALNANGTATAAKATAVMLALSYTPTFTPTSTRTFTPSPSPTATLSPTSTPTATPVRPRLRVKSDDVNLRTGPGTAFARAGTANTGDEFFIVAYYDSWYLIEIDAPTAKFAWIFNNLVELLTPSILLDRPVTIPAPPATRVPPTSTKAPTQLFAPTDAGRPPDTAEPTKPKPTNTPAFQPNPTNSTN